MSPLALAPFAAFLAVLPFPGTVALRLLLLAICGAIALRQWLRIPGARATVPCKKALAIWIAVGAASLTYSVNAAYSLVELKNEIGYAMVAFLSFFAVAGDAKRVRALLWGLAAGLALIGTWAAAAWAGSGYVWLEGQGFGGIGVFATYLVTALPALFWLATAEESTARRRTAFAIVVFAVFLAAITSQRAVWGALAVQAAVVLFLAQRNGTIRATRWQLAVALALVVALATVGIYRAQEVRYGNTRDSRVLVATDARLSFWPRVAARIAEHPVAGAGFGRNQMRAAYPDLVPADFTSLWHAHNVVLNYGIQMGVPGMLALLLLFGAFAAHFWSAAAGAAGIAGLALVAGVLMRNQFNDFFFRDMSLLFWALTGIFARLAANPRQGNPDDQQTSA